MNAGYLDTVTYGFKRDGNWIVAFRYRANNDGTLTSDDRAGQIPRGVSLDGSSFHSYLTYSSKARGLPPGELEKFKKSLPVQRTPGDEPGFGLGYWSTTKTYSSNGSGVIRETFKPL